MTTITDPASGVTTLVKPCKGCKAPVYFGFTSNGKRCPYDVVDGQPTRISHFTTCPQAAQFHGLHLKGER